MRHRGREQDDGGGRLTSRPFSRRTQVVAQHALFHITLGCKICFLWPYSLPERNMACRQASVSIERLKTMLAVMNIILKSIPCIALYLVATLALPLAASADSKLSYPYDKLNLDGRQAEQINGLNNEWKNRYGELEPRLQVEQKRLGNLLATPKSDPLEITGTQQRINQLKEQLSEQATANYLRKRRLLNTEQQRQLEGLLRRMVAQRGRTKS